ncbi:MAG: TonB-dependent receptor, partial [Comamonadaceae bacterium]
VYADGILLSNYLGNGIANGTNYAPRWGLVTPEEIDRVDVMYGPFSAAYPGNSAGAVVDYVTRMPTKLEAHVKAGYSSQPNELYGASKTYNAWQTSASLGSKSGDWSWWIDVNRTNSHGQPLTFTTATLASGVARSGDSRGTPVAGAVPGLNTTNTLWYLLGSGTAYHTVQDHAKLKLAYDFSPTVRATYTLGWWQNTSEGRPDTYLRNAAGQPVYSGAVNVGGRSFTLAPTAFPLTNDTQTHTMHGLSVKSNTQGVFDWEVAASLYDYSKDQQRAPTVALPLASFGGAGTLQDQGGTGWNTLAAKGTWRPFGVGGEHIVDFGIGRDAYKLSIAKNNVIGSWLDGAANPWSPVSNVGGKTETFNAWAQDTWSFAPTWKAVLGLRYEDWKASNGFTSTANSLQRYASRSEADFSPKAALAYQVASDT